MKKNKKSAHRAKSANKKVWKYEPYNPKLGLTLFFIVTVSLSLFVFMSVEDGITGHVVLKNSEPIQLQEYKNVASLGTLAPGTYFISENGIVYWIDDESNPAVGKVVSIDETQKNKAVYIDSKGNIGYLLPLK